MKSLKYLIIITVLPLLAFTAAHKYYVSITQIEYVKEKQSLQLITRIFVDDLEQLICTRYDETITLAENEAQQKADGYIERYLKSKIIIKINGAEVAVNFLGKEYENDIVYCYLEVEKVASIQSFEITNRVLFDLFTDQKNIIRSNINNENNSFILNRQNDKGMLNFK